MTDNKDNKVADNKDQKYEKTGQEGDGKLDVVSPTTNKFLCFTAVPGEHYTSQITTGYCDSCQKAFPTKVATSWNLMSCALCYFCGGYWGCYQLLKGKDFTPKNAEHSCGLCDKKLAHYTSC